MMRKWLTPFIIVFFLTGCWDRVEINDLALVLASGVDRTENGQLEVTFQIALPSVIGMPGGTGGGGAAGSQRPVIVKSAIGRDMDDATHRLQEKLSRRVFMGHRGIFIIGQSLAEKGIENILDELSRSPNSRLQSYVLTARNTTAKQILSEPYPLEKVPEEGLRELEENGVGVATTLNQFLNELATIGDNPVTGTIEARHNDYILRGAAAYSHNKLTGIFSEQEARGILWISGKVKRAEITTSIPKEPGVISTELLHNTSSITPILKHGKLKISVHLKAVGRIAENNTNLDLSDPEILKSIQYYVGKDIQKRIYQTVLKSQKDLKTDVFGFGESVHRQYPEFWKQHANQWEKLYPDVPVQVTAKIRIIRIGRSGAPVHLHQNEIQKSK